MNGTGITANTFAGFRVTPWGRALQAFIVLMPCLHAFGLAPWLPIPLIVAGGLALFAFAIGAVRWIWITWSDTLLLGMFACGVLAIGFNLDFAGEKNFNHSLALAVTITIFFVWMRALIIRASLPDESMGAAATLALLISSAAIIFEFWSANTAGVYLADFIPYSADDLTVASVLDGSQRPRGLAAEPGFSAMVFEALGPISLFYLLRNPLLLLSCGPVIVAGFLLLFSAGAISSIVLALLIISFQFGGRTLRLFVLIGLAGFALVLLVGLETLSALYEQIVGRKISDLFVQGDANVGEAAGRYEAYRVGAEIVAQYPLGIGWGMISQMFYSGAVLPGVPPLASRGLLSLYGEVIVSAGIVGFALYALFHMRHLYLAYRLKNEPIAPFLMVGALSITFHHAFILEFWFPMLWFYFALIRAHTMRLGGGI